MALVSRPWYTRYDRSGDEQDVRWLRLGPRRCYVEVGRWGIDIRIGPARLSGYFDRDDEPPTA
jgi:hypothetical protein